MHRSTICVTGANAQYFSMACMLLQSFKVECPGGQLYICDFGLTAKQKKFLNRAGVLLKRPEHLNDDLHPFCLKASIGDFVSHLEFDNLIWLDSDIFLTGDICGPITKALKTLPEDKPGIVLSRNCGEDSLAHFVGRWPVNIFDTLLSHLGVKFPKCIDFDRFHKGF